VSRDRYLATYLNDHLAGATVGVELARRAAGSNKAGRYGPALKELADEIAEDRETLLKLMADVGVGRDRIKVAAAWSAEKVGRLKPNGHLTSYSPLSRLEELEILSLGVEGKLSMWRSLRDAHGPTFGGADLEHLIERGTRQRQRLEELHRDASREALVGASPRAGKPAPG
jgi:hypothetical protein